MLVMLGMVVTSALVLFSQGERPGHPSTAEPGKGRGQPGADRIVKHVDFDERKLGNLESIPMRWVRHQGKGFPAYTTGRFDYEVGNASPPSFYLQLDGRSCAFHYTAADIPVESNSDYRVTARIRPDGLMHARAYLSAYLLDARGERLDYTEHRSELVGGEPGGSDWVEVSVRLSGIPEGAVSLGLGVWVTQRTVWGPGSDEIKHIDLLDIRGGAWFDDISVYRLPTIELSCSSAGRGNVYKAAEPVELLVRVGDATEDQLSARLRVRDMELRTIHEEEIRGSGATPAKVHRSELKALNPGAYRAELTVALSDILSIDRQIQFAVLPPAGGLAVDHKSRFGVVLERQSVDDWRSVDQILDALAVGHVKIPLPLTAVQSPPENTAELDSMIRGQADRNVVMTGVLETGVLAGGQQSEHVRQSLVDLLSSPPAAWQPAVADAVTKYEGLLRNWQVGRDGQVDIIADERLPGVVASLRQEMSNLTNRPVLVAPWTTTRQIDAARPPANILSLSVPAQTPPSAIQAHIDDPFSGGGFEELWALIEVLPSQPDQRLPRLADYCKRLIFASQSDADRIFVPQPWRSRSTPTGVVTEPDELLVLYDVVTSMLTEASYVGELEADGTAQCHAFDRRGQAVIAMWDDGAPPEGREHQLYLAGSDRQIDAWGKSRVIESKSDTAGVKLTSIPSFAMGAETWLIEFRRSLKFEPTLLASTQAGGDLRLRVSNPRREPISGSIRLKEPEGWQIRPAQFSFAIQPGETFFEDLRIQAGIREPAGPKQIRAEIKIDATRLHQFETGLSLEVGLADVDVWADVVLQGNAAIVRHGVTNRSSDTMTLRSFADAPGRKRQNLNIVGLQPNQTIVKAHQFQDASELSGKRIRVGLQQIRGPRSHNISLRVP